MSPAVDSCNRPVHLSNSWSSKLIAKHFGWQVCFDSLICVLALLLSCYLRSAAFFTCQSFIFEEVSSRPGFGRISHFMPRPSCAWGPGFRFRTAGQSLRKKWMWILDCLFQKSTNIVGHGISPAQFWCRKVVGVGGFRSYMTIWQTVLM